MQNSVALTSIPFFLTASTPKELRRLMLKNNLQTGIVFKYFDIQQMQDGNWIAWYFHDIEYNSLVKSDLKKEKDNGGLS